MRKQKETNKKKRKKKGKRKLEKGVYPIKMEIPSF